MSAAPVAALAVSPERTKADRKAFLELPYRLYRGHPVWVPPVRMSDAALMNKKKNPFFAHGDAQHFLARRGDRVVGRIAAIENRLHNEFHGDRLGFFGWFDCESDPEAAAALVRAAHGWTAGRGLVGMRGPVNYSTNDVCGVLIEGFDDPPTLMMPYNREDYDALLLQAGLVKSKDLVSYWMRADAPPAERHARILDRAMARSGVTLRPLDMSRFAAEIAMIKDLYNRGWEKNWGFVPATDEEFAHAAKDLKMVVDPRTFLIAERGGKAVGFGGGVLDLNQTLHGLDGRLFPFGLVKILLRKKKISRLRVMILGIVPEARGKGIESAFFVGLIRACHAAGYDGGEGGWILEDNALMRAGLDSLGMRVTKRYRLYETPAGA